MLPSVAFSVTSSPLHSCLFALGSNQLQQLVRNSSGRAQASQGTSQSGLLWQQQQQQRHKHTFSSSGLKPASQLLHSSSPINSTGYSLQLQRSNSTASSITPQDIDNSTASSTTQQDIDDFDDFDSMAHYSSRKPYENQNQLRMLHRLTVAPEQQQLQHQLDTLLGQARSNTPDAELDPAATATLQAAERENDQWLLVQCGEWAQHPQGWTGPARALLQVWFEQQHEYADYTVWELDPSGLPTGQSMTSASAFEKLTTRAGSRKFRASLLVQLQDEQVQKPWGSKSVSLETWLKAVYGTAYIKPKYLGECNNTWKYHPGHPDYQQPQHSRSGSGKSGRTSSSSSSSQRLDKRLEKYIGWGPFPPGEYAEAALQAAESAAAGPAPHYIWPQEAPAVLSGDMQPPAMDRKRVSTRNNLLRNIADGIVDLIQTHTPLLALHPELESPSSILGSSSSSMSSSSSQDSNTPPGPQVYDLLQLQQRANAAGPGAVPAVVPDSSRPFTVTLHNGADGLDYVVAHYEPQALSWNSAGRAALLCQVFHSNNQIKRASAPQEEKMAMGGMRRPRGPSGQFGRYVGDNGPEADQFSLGCWPYLVTAGGFQTITDLWIDTLPGLVCKKNHDETSKVTRGKRGMVTNTRGPPANYPAPTLFGSPFTTLAVTQNYLSHLHCEPEEHPFSYIVWLDVLSSGSSMEVGHFWLTNGLAFTPHHGSALYIDVRLVTHCSDPCTVKNAKSELEGRYGAALFIKPGVYQTNAKAWAQFDEHQAQQRQVVKQLDGSHDDSAELTDWGGSGSDSDLWSGSDSEESDASSPAAETVGT